MAGSLFEEGLFEATGEPAKLVTGFCNTDEALHVVTTGGNSVCGGDENAYVCML